MTIPEITLSALSSKHIPVHFGKMDNPVALCLCRSLRGLYLLGNDAIRQAAIGAAPVAIPALQECQPSARRRESAPYPIEHGGRRSPGAACVQSHGPPGQAAPGRRRFTQRI